MSSPHSPDDNEPIATTPTHEADPGHMSGAEEAPPTLNPTPAVVPSPDDSAKEVTKQELDVTGGGIEDDMGMADDVLEARSDNDILEDDSKFIDVEGDEADSEGTAERLGSVSIDPSYNPNSEELLYEGDMEAEMPLPKSISLASGADKESASQDEGFMISVHETGMELDIAESLNEPNSKSGGLADNGSGSAKRSGEGGASAKPSSKSTSDGKRSSPGKELDRFVQSL